MSINIERIDGVELPKLTQIGRSLFFKKLHRRAIALFNEPPSLREASANAKRLAEKMPSTPRKREKLIHMKVINLKVWMG
jgi:hypothetical protein